MSVKKLKKIREESGHTVRSLAKDIGVNMSSISYWENGVKSPRQRNKIKLQTALGVPYIKLFENEELNESEEDVNGK